jgi:hypothetical protein
MTVNDNTISPIFQLFFEEEMDMAINIPEASTILMAPPNGSNNSTGSNYYNCLSHSKGIQLDSAILARPSTIPVGSAIPEVIPIHSATRVHLAILVQSGNLEASVVPPPKSPHFTPAANTYRTYTYAYTRTSDGESIMDCRSI